MSRETKKLDEDFYRAYERLSKIGRCDSPGGMEYQRVFEEWKEAGRPLEIDAFIGEQANSIPPEILK